MKVYAPILAALLVIGQHSLAGQEAKSGDHAKAKPVPEGHRFLRPAVANNLPTFMGRSAAEWPDGNAIAAKAVDADAQPVNDSGHS